MGHPLFVLEVSVLASSEALNLVWVKARRSSSPAPGVTLLESRPRRDDPQGPKGRSVSIPHSEFRLPSPFILRL